jgi:hypothetical protein
MIFYYYIITLSNIFIYTYTQHHNYYIYYNKYYYYYTWYYYHKKITPLTLSLPFFPFPLWYTRDSLPVRVHSSFASFLSPEATARPTLRAFAECNLSQRQVLKEVKTVQFLQKGVFVLVSNYDAFRNGKFLLPANPKRRRSRSEG